jgi:hypothetical protein
VVRVVESLLPLVVLLRHQLVVVVLLLPLMLDPQPVVEHLVP